MLKRSLPAFIILSYYSFSFYSIFYLLPLHVSFTFIYLFIYILLKLVSKLYLFLFLGPYDSFPLSFYRFLTVGFQQHFYNEGKC